MKNLFYFHCKHALKTSFYFKNVHHVMRDGSHFPSAIESIIIIAGRYGVDDQQTIKNYDSDIVVACM